MNKALCTLMLGASLIGCTRVDEYHQVPLKDVREHRNENVMFTGKPIYATVQDDDLVIALIDTGGMVYSFTDNAGYRRGNKHDMLNSVSHLLKKQRDVDAWGEVDPDGNFKLRGMKLEDKIFYNHREEW